MATIRRLACIASVLTLSVAVPASAQSLVDGYASPGGTEQSAVAGKTKVQDVGQVRGAVESAPIAQTGSAPASGSPSAASPSAAPASASTPQVSGSKLPFTGLDARLILLGGLILALIGFATRRVANRVG